MHLLRPNEALRHASIEGAKSMKGESLSVRALPPAICSGRFQMPGSIVPPRVAHERSSGSHAFFATAGRVQLA